MTYSDEFREFAIRQYSQHGAQVIEYLEEMFGVSRSTVFSWCAQARDDNKWVAKRTRTLKGWRGIPPHHLRVAIDALEMYPMLYLHELCDIIYEQFQVTYSSSQMQEALEQEKYTEKKMDYRAREQSIALRQVFMATICQFSTNQLVFVDESHARPEDLRRKYGRALHNQPAFMYIPGVAHGENATPVGGICALSCEGMLVSHIYEGEVNADIFIKVLREEILPIHIHCLKAY